MRRGISASARDAVSAVRAKFPPGTTVKNRFTGKLYVTGEKYGMSGFWLMDIAASTKGVVQATEIVRQFEKVPA